MLNGKKEALKPNTPHHKEDNTVEEKNNDPNTQTPKKEDMPMLNERLIEVIIRVIHSLSFYSNERFRQSEVFGSLDRSSLALQDTMYSVDFDIIKGTFLSELQSVYNVSIDPEETSADANKTRLPLPFCMYLAELLLGIYVDDKWFEREKQTVSFTQFRDITGMSVADYLFLCASNETPNVLVDNEVRIPYCYLLEYLLKNNNTQEEN